jgi:hypothetical protein
MLQAVARVPEQIRRQTRGPIDHRASRATLWATDRAKLKPQSAATMLAEIKRLHGESADTIDVW